MSTLDDYVSSDFMWNSHIALLPLRVNQNSLVFCFELKVAKCFYLRRNLFPSFGYGKVCEGSGKQIAGNLDQIVRNIYSGFEPIKAR